MKINRKMDFGTRIRIEIKPVKTTRDSRSHTSFNTEKKRKAETRLIIDSQKKKRDSRYHTTFNIKNKKYSKNDFRNSDQNTHQSNY